MPSGRVRRLATICRYRSDPRHSTQEHPFEVVIHYPHHPRAGECVLAFRRLVHGNRLHFVIEQPGGCRVLLPAWMAESPAGILPMVAVPRLSLAALRELRGLVDAQRLSSSPSSGTTRMGGGDDGTATARTMATARSPGARDQRKPAPAARSDGSRGGHGPAQVASRRVRRRPRQDGGGGGRIKK